VKIAIDTNILAYAEGVNGESLRQRAVSFIQRIPNDNVVIPTQVVAELFHLLVRKGGFARPAAWSLASRWHNSYDSAPTTKASMAVALDLALGHELQIFDAVILAAAAEAQCSLLLSEDMHDGFTWHGVTVANPFKPNPHVLLQLLLTSES